MYHSGKPEGPNACQGAPIIQGICLRLLKPNKREIGCATQECMILDEGFQQYACSGPSSLAPNMFVIKSFPQNVPEHPREPKQECRKIWINWGRLGLSLRLHAGTRLPVGTFETSFRGSVSSAFALLCFLGKP